MACARSRVRAALIDPSARCPPLPELVTRDLEIAQKTAQRLWPETLRRMAMDIGTRGLRIRPRRNVGEGCLAARHEYGPVVAAVLADVMNLVPAQWQRVLLPREPVDVQEMRPAR